MAISATLAGTGILWAFGIFVPGALAPSRVLDGNSRSFIAIAVVLVSAMIIASSCQPQTSKRPVAKSDNGARNKTTA